jgi:serine/threonine-protein kinase
VKLLDFGIARLIDDGAGERTALTEISGRALTPAFASPEQIRGEPLGVATDVYSIGVVAFLLLAGRMPYQLRRGSAAELEEAIARASVPRASDVAVDPVRRRELRGDLDAILSKALRPDAAERYSSVESLADDLRRHRDGRPVIARPQSRVYLAGRFLARHRAGAGAAALVVLALAGGLGGAMWQAGEARKAQRLAERAVKSEVAVQDMLLEIVAVGVTADPEKLRQPDGFARLLEAKFDELEARFKERPDDWLDLLEVLSTRLPQYGDLECSYAVGVRYLALLQSSHADPRRIARAALNQARVVAKLGGTKVALRVVNAGLAQLPPGVDDALRSALKAQRDALAR